MTEYCSADGCTCDGRCRELHYHDSEGNKCAQVYEQKKSQKRFKKRKNFRKSKSDEDDRGERHKR